MLDLTLLVAVSLLIVTAMASALYCREIRKVRKEYEEAKDVIGDVVISFKADIEEERQRLSVVSRDTEMVLSENKRIQKRIEDHGSQLRTLATKIEEVSGLETKLSAQFGEIRKDIGDLTNNQKHINQRVTKIEQLRPQRARSAVEQTKIKTVIPIRRDRALGSLTQTELDVLEFLVREGRKTAPEIKERIKLTREHTARLMKNLYEKGYLERNTDKLPYSYSIKDAMRKILKNPLESQ